MRTFTHPLKTILLFSALLFSFPSANAQYTIKNVFGDLAECDTMTRGIFIVWWDKDFDLASKADELLDTMLSYRSVCLNDMGMSDPPNPLAGFYYNVYLHGSGYFSAFNWGNGQGTDSNGYPFLTLPTGLANDWPNTAHETFHVFQYNGNAPGFAYSGDSQWFIEASANWFAARQNPNENRRFVEAESLVRLPQVPFWLSYDNFPASYPQNWQRYVHQYALALHLYYLTEVAGVPENVVTSGLYSGTNELPQEYMYHLIGAADYRQYFIDWAAHMTNDFDFIPPIQAATNLNEWNDYADPDDDNEFIAMYENEGTGGWFSPDEDEGTHAWSFNTYKLINSQTMTYTFDVNGEPSGNFGDAAFFQGQVLVKNNDTGASFHDLNMVNNLDGSLSLDLTPQDTAVYFIIASMPEVFRDDNPTFQSFPYQMRIEASETTAVAEPASFAFKTEIGRYNLLGQEITESVGGLQLILFDDGTVEKVFVVKGK